MSESKDPSEVNASSEVPTKVETSNESSVAAESDVDEAALQAIDKELAIADPQFISELQQITAVQVEQSELEIESYNPDHIELEKEEVEEKSNRLHQIFPFLPKVKLKIKNAGTSLNTFIHHIFFFQIPELGRWLLQKVKFGFGFIKDKISNFFGLPLKAKLLFLFFTVFFFGGCYFIFYFWKVNPLSKPTEMFVTNLESLSTETVAFNYKIDMEPFFYNFRLSQNVFTTERLVVNLRPSPNSGPNPMAALELFLSGTSADVVIEIKDREAEMKDVMLRAIEEFTFDDIVTQQGKQNLTERIARVLNTVLTKGKVKAVYYKSVVFKP